MQADSLLAIKRELRMLSRAGAFGVKLLIAFGIHTEQYSVFYVGAIGHSPSPVFSRGG
jgi:hypothetical protein